MTLPYFTPKEVCAAIKMPTATLRKYRNSDGLDLVDGGEGHRSIAMSDVLRIILMRSLVNDGVPPQRAASIVNSLSVEGHFEAVANVLDETKGQRKNPWVEVKGPYVIIRRSGVDDDTSSRSSVYRSVGEYGYKATESGIYGIIPTSRHIDFRSIALAGYVAKTAILRARAISKGALETIAHGELRKFLEAEHEDFMQHVADDEAGE